MPLALGLFSTMLGLGQFLGSLLGGFLLGPELSNYLLTALTLLGIGILGFICNQLCRYK